MDTNLVFGALALMFGATTLILRFAAPDSAMFRKLEPMKKQFGNTVGTAIHVVSYTVIPLIAGVVLIGAALRGG